MQAGGKARATVTEVRGRMNRAKNLNISRGMGLSKLLFSKIITYTEKQNLPEDWGSLEAYIAHLRSWQRAWMWTLSSCIKRCRWPCQRSSRWHLNLGVWPTRMKDTGGWISDRQDPRVSAPECLLLLLCLCVYIQCHFPLVSDTVWMGMGYPHCL